MDFDISTSGKLILLVALPTTALLLYFLWRYRDEEDESGDDKRNVTTSRQTVIEVKIPRKAVGAVIGRQGSNIKELQQRTGTRINFKDESGAQGDEDRTMIIRGQTEAAQNAELSIRKFIANMPVIVTEEIFVPVKCLGRIIGRNGDTIRNISRSSNAKVYIDKTRADYREGSHLITITGSREQIEVAKSIIEEKVSEDEEFRAKIAVMAANRQHQPRRRKDARPEQEIQSLTQQVSVPGEVWEDMIPVDCVNTADSPWPATHEMDYLEIYISAVEHPGHFWVQILTTKALQLESLTDQINMFYGSSTTEDYKPAKLDVGDIVVAPFHEDSSWYRARVLGFVDDKVDLYFVDYGDNGLAKQHELRNLRSDFLSLPFQAVECYLAHVNPKGDEWSEDAISDFEEMTHYSKWRVVMAKNKHYKQRGDDLIPCLWLIDTNGEQDVIINDELVKRGYGEWDARYCSSDENPRRETTLSSTFLQGPPPEEKVVTVRMPVQYCDWARDYTWSWPYTDQDNSGIKNQDHGETLAAGKDHDKLLFSDKMRQKSNSDGKNKSEKDLLNRSETEQLQTLSENVNNLYPEFDVHNKDVICCSGDDKNNKSLIPRFETVKLVTNKIQTDNSYPKSDISSQKPPDASSDNPIYNLPSTDNSNSKCHAGVAKKNIEPGREGGILNEKSEMPDIWRFPSTEVDEVTDLCVEPSESTHVPKHSSNMGGQASSPFGENVAGLETAQTVTDSLRTREEGSSADDEYSSGLSEKYDPNNNPNVDTGATSQIVLFNECELKMQGLLESESSENILHVEEINLSSKDAEIKLPSSTVESESSSEWPGTLSWGTGLLVPVDAGQSVSEDMSICSNDKSIPGSSSMASGATDVIEQTDVEMVQTSDTLSASDVSASMNSYEPLPESEPLYVSEIPEQTDLKLDIGEDSLLDASLLTDCNTASEVDDSTLTWDSGVYGHNASLDGGQQQQLYSSPVVDTDFTAVESSDDFTSRSNQSLKQKTSLDTDVLQCTEDTLEEGTVTDTCSNYTADTNDDTQCMRRQHPSDSGPRGSLLESNTGDVEKREVEDKLIEPLPSSEIPSESETRPVEHTSNQQHEPKPFQQILSEECETEPVETPSEVCEIATLKTLNEECKIEPIATPSERFQTELVKTPREEQETELAEIESAETASEEHETEKVEAPGKEHDTEKQQAEFVDAPIEECKLEPKEEISMEKYESDLITPSQSENEPDTDSDEQTSGEEYEPEPEPFETPFETCETEPFASQTEECETEEVKTPIEEYENELAETLSEKYEAETTEKQQAEFVVTPIEESKLEPEEISMEKYEPDLITPSQSENEPEYDNDLDEQTSSEDCETETVETLKDKCEIKPVETGSEFETEPVKTLFQECETESIATLSEKCETEEVKTTSEEHENELAETLSKEYEAETTEKQKAEFVVTPIEECKFEPEEIPMEKYEPDLITPSQSESEPEYDTDSGEQTSGVECETEPIEPPFEKCEAEPVNEECEAEPIATSSEKCETEEIPMEKYESDLITSSKFENEPKYDTDSGEQTSNKECETEPFETPFETCETEQFESQDEECKMEPISTPSEKCETEEVKTPSEEYETELAETLSEKYEAETTEKQQAEFVDRPTEECKREPEIPMEKYEPDLITPSQSESEPDYNTDSDEQTSNKEYETEPVEIMKDKCETKQVETPFEKCEAEPVETINAECEIEHVKTTFKECEAELIVTSSEKCETEQVKTASEEHENELAETTERQQAEFVDTPMEKYEPDLITPSQSESEPEYDTDSGEQTCETEPVETLNEFKSEPVKTQSEESLQTKESVGEIYLQDAVDSHDIQLEESSGCYDVANCQVIAATNMAVDDVHLFATDPQNKDLVSETIEQDGFPQIESVSQEVCVEESAVIKYATEDTTVDHLKISQNGNGEAEALVQEEKQFSEVAICHDEEINFDLTMPSEHSELSYSVMKGSLLPSDNLAQETETTVKENILLPELVSCDNAALEFEVAMQELPVGACRSVMSSCQQDFQTEVSCTDETKVSLDEIIGITEVAVNEYPQTENEMALEQISEEHENCIVLLDNDKREHLRTDKKQESETDNQELILTLGTAEHDGTEMYDEYSLEHSPLEIENGLRSSHSREYMYIRGNDPEGTEVNFQEENQECEVSEQLSSEEVHVRSESLVGSVNESDCMACLQNEAEETESQLQRGRDECLSSETDIQSYSQVFGQTDTFLGTSHYHEIMENKAVEMNTRLQAASEKLEEAEHEVEGRDVTCLQHITEEIKLSLPSVIDSELTVGTVLTTLATGVDQLDMVEDPLDMVGDPLDMVGDRLDMVGDRLDMVEDPVTTDVDLQKQVLSNLDLKLCSLQSTPDTENLPERDQSTQLASDQQDSEIRVDELTSRPQNILQDGRENVVPVEPELSIECIPIDTPEASVCDGIGMSLVIKKENEEEALIENFVDALVSDCTMSDSNFQTMSVPHSVMSVTNQILSDAPNGELSTVDVKREQAETRTDFIEGMENDEKIDSEDLSVMMAGDTPLATTLVSELDNSYFSDQIGNIIYYPDDEMLIRTLVVEPAIRILSETDPAIILEPTSYGSGQTKYENYGDMDMSGLFESEMLQRHLEASVQTAKMMQSSSYCPIVATIDNANIIHPKPHLLKDEIGPRNDDIEPSYLNVPQVARSRDIFKEKTPPPVIKKPQSRTSGGDSQVSKPEDVYVEPEPRHRLHKSLSRSRSISSYSMPVSYNNPCKTWSRGASLDMDYTRPGDAAHAGRCREQVYIKAALSQIPALQKDLDKSLSEFCKLVTSALGDMTTGSLIEESNETENGAGVPFNQVLQSEDILEAKSVDLENCLQLETTRITDNLQETEIRLENGHGTDETDVSSFDQEQPLHQSMECKNYLEAELTEDSKVSSDNGKDAEESLPSPSEITSSGIIYIESERDMRADTSFDEENHSVSDEMFFRSAEQRNLNAVQQRNVGNNCDTDHKGDAEWDLLFSEEGRRICQCEESPRQSLLRDKDNDESNEICDKIYSPLQSRSRDKKIGESDDVFANDMSVKHNSSAVEMDQHRLLAPDDLFEGNFQSEVAVNVIEDSEPSLQPWQQITDKYYGEELHNSSVASDDVELFIDEEKLLKDLMDSTENSEIIEVSADQKNKFPVSWARDDEEDGETSSDSDSDFMENLRPLYDMGEEKKITNSDGTGELAREETENEKLMTREQQIHETDCQPPSSITDERLVKILKSENEQSEIDLYTSRNQQHDIDGMDQLLFLSQHSSQKRELGSSAPEEHLSPRNRPYLDEMHDSTDATNLQDVQTHDGKERDLVFSGQHNCNNLMQKDLFPQFNNERVKEFEGDSKSEGQSDESRNDADISESSSLSEEDHVSRELINDAGVPVQDTVSSPEIMFKEIGNMFDMHVENKQVGKEIDHFSDSANVSNNSRSDYNTDEYSSSAKGEVCGDSEVGSSCKHRSDVDDEQEHKVGGELLVTISSDLSVQSETDPNDSLRKLEDLEDGNDLKSPCGSSNKAETYCIDKKVISNNSSVGKLSEVYSQNVGRIDEVFMTEPEERRWKESSVEVGRNVAGPDGMMEEQREDMELVRALAEAVQDSNHSQITMSDSKVDEDLLMGNFDAAHLQMVDSKASEDKKTGKDMIRDIDTMGNDPTKNLTDEDKSLQEIHDIGMQKLGSCIDKMNAHDDKNTVTVEATSCDKFEFQISPQNLVDHPTTGEIAKTSHQSNNMVDEMMEDNVEMGFSVKPVFDYKLPALDHAATEICPPVETEDDIVNATEESDTDMHFQDNFNEFVIGLSPIHSSFNKIDRSSESTAGTLPKSCFEDEIHSSPSEQQFTGVGDFKPFSESGIAMETEKKEELSESWTTISNEDIAERLEVDAVAEFRAESILMSSGTDKIQHFITMEMDEAHDLSAIQRDETQTLITGETDMVDSLADNNCQKSRGKKIKKSKPIKIPDTAVQESVYSTDGLLTETVEARQTTLPVVSKSDSITVEKTRDIVPEKSKKKKKKKIKEKSIMSQSDDSQCEKTAFDNEIVVPTIEMHKSELSSSIICEQTISVPEFKMDTNSSCRSIESSDAQAGDGTYLNPEGEKKKKKKSHINKMDETSNKTAHVDKKSILENRPCQDVDSVFQSPRIVEHLTEAVELSSVYPNLSADKDLLTSVVKRKKRKSKSRSGLSEVGEADTVTSSKPRNAPKPLSNDLKLKSRVAAKQLKSETMSNSRLVEKSKPVQGNVEYRKKNCTKQSLDPEIESSVENNSKFQMTVLTAESGETSYDSVQGRSFSENEMEHTSQLLCPRQDKVLKRKQRSRSANVCKVTESSLSVAHSKIESGRSKSNRRVHRTTHNVNIHGSHPHAAFSLGSLAHRHRRRKKNIVYVNVAATPHDGDSQPTKRKKRSKKH